MQPVPGYRVTTPYGIRSTHWSCSPDARGWGIHTGVDIAAPTGVRVVAARPGRVEHVNFGSAFGDRQVAVVRDDGTRDFYAHMQTRVTHGLRVAAGDPVGTVGARGNVTGPHLHFERHTVATGGWSCGIVTDPAASLNYQGNDDMPDIVNAAPRARNLPAGEWVNLEWTRVNDPEQIVRPNDDPAGLRLGGREFILTTHLRVTVAEGSSIRFRSLEREGGETTETHPVNELVASSGDSWVQDTRSQSAAPNARIRIQVHSTSGGRVVSGNMFGLLW